MPIIVYTELNNCYLKNMNRKLKNILLVVNPVSGRGKSIDMLPEIDNIFSNIDVKTDIHITENPQQATEIVRIASRCGYKRIAAVGGDGTVNMVAAGLLGTNSILGVIPCGTGNDFFKMLKIDNDLENICRTAAFGDKIDLDVGVINDRPFFNMLGIGFDAEVAKEANKMDSNLGLFTYLSAVFKVWRRFPTFDIKLRIDSYEVDHQVMLVAVGIGRSTGGGFLLTPQALANDGKFDVCVIKKTSRLNIFSILRKVLKGSHVRLPETRVYRCRQLQVSSDKALPIHYEGETFSSSNGRLSIKMSSNKLRVAARV